MFVKSYLRNLFRNASFKNVVFSSLWPLIFHQKVGYFFNKLIEDYSTAMAKNSTQNRGRSHFPFVPVKGGWRGLFWCGICRQMRGEKPFTFTRRMKKPKMSTLVNSACFFHPNVTLMYEQLAIIFLSLFQKNMCTYTVIWPGDHKKTRRKNTCQTPVIKNST